MIDLRFLLVNSSNANASEYLSGTEKAARTMGVQRTARVEVANLEALLALKPAVFNGAAAVMVLPDAVFWNHRGAIVALLAGPPNGITVTLAPVHDESGIEAAVAMQAHEPGGALIALPDESAGWTVARRCPIDPDR